MMKMNTNKLLGSMAVCYAFLAVSFLTGCSSPAESKPGEDKAAAEASPARETFVLQKGKLSSALQLPGELIAFQQVDIYAKNSSFVKKLYADVGTQVKAGQLLAQMEAPELNSQLAGAESRLKSQEAVYLASKANYDRLYETSQTPGTISQNDLDQAMAKKNSDLAQLEAAKAAYKEISQTRDYLSISAPFSGVISARNVNTGAYVGPSGKGSELPMFTLQQQDRLRLVVSVPEDFTGFLTNSSKVGFTVRALPNEKFTAQVSRLAGALDSRLRSERVEMDVFNDNKKLLPGMVAEVTLPTPAKDSTLIVPKTALVNSTEKIFVIRVVNNKAEWVDVKPGRESAGRIEVYGNLSPGDVLLKTASDEIRNGSELKNTKLVQ
jgi:membrane fusion protein (multidrug efflux system)